MTISCDKMEWYLRLGYTFSGGKGGTPKSVKPKPLPPPAATPTEIVAQAAQAKSGERQGRRLRKRTGRATSVATRPSLAFQPANVAQAGLSTSLG